MCPDPRLLRFPRSSLLPHRESRFSYRLPEPFGGHETVSRGRRLIRHRVHHVLDDVSSESSRLIASHCTSTYFSLIRSLAVIQQRDFQPVGAFAAFQLNQAIGAAMVSMPDDIGEGFIQRERDAAAHDGQVSRVAGHHELQLQTHAGPPRRSSATTVTSSAGGTEPRKRSTADSSACPAAAADSTGKLRAMDSRLCIPSCSPDSSQVSLTPSVYRSSRSPMSNCTAVWL